MIQMTVIGVGAAGNKAAISLIENNILDSNHVKLLNTSSKDIPEEYKNSDIFIPFNSGLGGCGKESAKGKAAITEAIQHKQIAFDELYNEDSREVILVSSVEGGTGSGSVPVIATYFEAMEVPVHVFAFIGFQDEARGINNTLKFFKDLPEKTILHTIKNSYFLDYTKNYGKAEQAANMEFCREIEILRGTKLVPSKQIMDDTDLYKINTQPGYTTINHIILNDIKNTESYNAALAAAFENSCYMDNDASAKRIAIMVNATKKVQDAVDNSMECITRYFGVPIEKFQHIQPDNEADFEGPDDYIDVVACGMNFPEKAIRDTSNKYEKIKEKLNTERKSFDAIFNDIDTDDLDEFNMDVKTNLDPSKANALFGVDGAKPIKKESLQPKEAPTKNPIQTESKATEASKEEVKKEEPKKAPETTQIPPSTLPIKNKRDVSFQVGSEMEADVEIKGDGNKKIDEY